MINNVIIDTMEKDVQTFWSDLLDQINNKEKKYNAVIVNTNTKISKRSESGECIA